MDEEDYKEQRKRAVFYFGFVFLIVISVGTVIASDNPMGAFTTLIVLWWLTIVIIRRRHKISDWFNSDKTFRNYLADNKTHNEEVRQATLNNTLLNTMDSQSNSPLTVDEEAEWKNIVSSLNSDDK